MTATAEGNAQDPGDQHLGRAPSPANPGEFVSQGRTRSLGSGLFGGNGSGGVGTGAGLVGIGTGNGSVGVGKGGSVGVTGASGGTSGFDVLGCNHFEAGRWILFITLSQALNTK
jgi:hypothetical protein